MIAPPLAPSRCGADRRSTPRCSFSAHFLAICRRPRSTHADEWAWFGLLSDTIGIDKHDRPFRHTLRHRRASARHRHTSRSQSGRFGIGDSCQTAVGQSDSQQSESPQVAPSCCRNRREWRHRPCRSDRRFGSRILIGLNPRAPPPHSSFTVLCHRAKRLPSTEDFGKGASRRSCRKRMANNAASTGAFRESWRSAFLPGHDNRTWLIAALMIHGVPPEEDFGF